jgi:CRISPR-associated protein Cas2
MSKFMRIMVYYDLPAVTRAEKREHARFRRALLDDGYDMMQWSVYTRICNGSDSVKKHEKFLENNRPKQGSIRCLIITEKQFQSIKVIGGKKKWSEKKKSGDQLTFFL